MITLETEDNYSITLTPDTLILTLEGYIPCGDLTVGTTIWTNGSDKPTYMDKEALKRLYIDKNMTQKEIADLLNISERTIRLYIHKFELVKNPNHVKLMGENNPRWKGDNVSVKGGYERTHEKFDKLKTGVCSRCHREGLPTQLHHDDRNPTNISDDNLIELCDLCHASEHHGAVVRWTRPAKITNIRYGGINKSYGFELEEGDNIIIEGFILKFPRENANKIDTLEKL